MAFDKHKTHGKGLSKHEHPENKKSKEKKPFGEGTHTDKDRNLDSYDKEQKHDKELGEKGKKEDS
jgi:hypothetical protein